MFRQNIVDPDHIAYKRAVGSGSVMLIIPQAMLDMCRIVDSCFNVFLDSLSV